MTRLYTNPNVSGTPTNNIGILVPISTVFCTAFYVPVQTPVLTQASIFALIPGLLGRYIDKN